VATPEATILTENEQLTGINADYEERYGFHDAENYLYKAPKGLSREIVEKISEFKSEPTWMREFRLKALEHFLVREQPTWGSPMLGELDYDDIRYFVRASETPSRSWDDVPEDVKRTFDRLGIPEVERKFLSGVGAQYESEVVYHQIHEDLEKQGVIFTDMDTALREHRDIVREYFATVIPPNDNKLAALNSAVWSGGSFVYVPEGVHIDMPLQAYFRINTENMGQFERTLIIAEPGSYVHYVEGCTAPTYSSDSLHSAVVELIAKPGARIRYTTVQNWSTNVYNLVTKRAATYADATVEWVDCNLGSKLTMKYPSIYLLGERAHSEVLSIAFAGAGQHQDAGAKIIHAAPNTTSNIFAKSICKDGGRGSYRGLLEIAKGAHGSKSKVVCDALLLDEHSRSDTYPTIRIGEDDVNVGHEATVSKVGDDQLFYLVNLPDAEQHREPVLSSQRRDRLVAAGSLLTLERAWTSDLTHVIVPAMAGPPQSPWGQPEPSLPPDKPPRGASGYSAPADNPCSGRPTPEGLRIRLPLGLV
jgi:Fe-S cluster assembly protein SufB